MERLNIWSPAFDYFGAGVVWAQAGQLRMANAAARTMVGEEGIANLVRKLMLVDCHPGSAFLCGAATQYLRVRREKLPNGNDLWFLHRQDQTPMTVSASQASPHHVAQERDRWRYIALHDALTGVKNRHWLKRYLARRPSGMVALVDCDDFRQVNTNFGHAFGDEVLGGIARAMSACARAGDHVVRVGGDEFVVVWPNTSESVAAHLARRLCDAVGTVTHHTTSGECARVTCSVGVARAPVSERVEDLLAVCRDALEESKRSGKNRVIVSGRALVDKQ